MSYRIINNNKIGLTTINKGNKRLHVSYFDMTGKVALWYDKGVTTKGLDFYLTGTYCFSGEKHIDININVLEKI